MTSNMGSGNRYPPGETAFVGHNLVYLLNADIHQREADVNDVLVGTGAPAPCRTALPER